MFKKKVYSLQFTVYSVLFFALLFTACFAQAATQEESDQQISEFSLAGYADKGKKSWDLAGKSADIFTETVKLNDVVGNLYAEDEDIRLTADTGDFNKVNGSVHLEKDVVITTSSGARLTTESLDWDRKNQTVSTQDTVNIEKENMVTVARGAKGQPNLKQIALEKEVRVDINPINEAELNEKEKTVITCDGPLEIDYEKNIAVFNNNVKVERPDTVIYSDKMDVYFIPAKKAEQSAQTSASLGGSAVGPASKSGTIMGSKIDKIICRGNVKVIRGENTSYSQEAIYTAQDKKLILTGQPKLVIYSTEDLKDASIGN